MASGSPNIYVCVGDVEPWVYIAKYGLVGLDDPLEVDIDEEVVGIDVLFDETFHLQKSREKIPFVLYTVRPGAAALSVSPNHG